jgi:Uma2 family endonuclease
LEFLSIPSEIHEALIQFLLFALHQFVASAKVGKVYSNGIRVRVRPDKVRLPDVLFLHKDHFAVRHNRVWDGADLVMEVVSDDPKDRHHDYQDKLVDYAGAGIAEYWIVDYERRVIIVHRLDGEKYAVLGEYAPDQQATSLLLEGFAVDVTQLFAAADDVPE